MIAPGKIMQIEFKIDKDGDLENLKSNETFKKFCLDHKGQNGIADFKVVKLGPRYYQHKYYRGYLLPVIARESFSDDLQEAHEYLKFNFLFIKCTELSQIKSEHRSKSNKYFEVIESKKYLAGYTPSTADLTYQEMKEFTLKVENFMNEQGFFNLDKESFELRKKTLYEG